MVKKTLLTGKFLVADWANVGVVHIELLDQVTPEVNEAPMTLETMVGPTELAAAVALVDHGPDVLSDADAM
jgi:hypothetical protein